MTRRFAAWLAILAMGLNGLWPLLANAAPADFVAPVCSMVGTTVAVDAGGMPVQPAPAKSPAPHCPFCTLGGDQNPGLANAPSHVPVQAATFAQPGLAAARFLPGFVFLFADPRGPPSSLI